MCLCPGTLIAPYGRQCGNVECVMWNEERAAPGMDCRVLSFLRSLSVLFSLSVRRGLCVRRTRISLFSLRALRVRISILLCGLSLVLCAAARGEAYGEVCHCEQCEYYDEVCQVLLWRDEEVYGVDEQLQQGVAYRDDDVWQLPLAYKQVEDEFVVWGEDVFAGEEALGCSESGVEEAYYEEYHHGGVSFGEYHGGEDVDYEESQGDGSDVSGEDFAADVEYAEYGHGGHKGDAEVDIHRCFGHGCGAVQDV